MSGKVDPNIRAKKVAAARLSVASNSVLTLAKLITGLLTGSVSILSEAVHSANDLVAALIAFFSVRVADMPADEEHPYGHGKIESLSGMVEAVLIFVAATYILSEAVHKLSHRGELQRIDIGLGVMVFSMAVNAIISARLRSVARETESPALMADAEHLRTDSLTSAGVVVGLGLVWATGKPIFDPLIAMGVALIIYRSAWSLLREAVGPLVDAHLPPEEIAQLEKILNGDQDVRGFHKLRTRRSGSHRHIDAHVLLDDELTLLEAHAITERLEDAIRLTLPNVEITLHTEPYKAELWHQHEEHGAPLPVLAQPGASEHEIREGE
jgi:cation diffusion facilitator family transporter